MSIKYCHSMCFVDSIAAAVSVIVLLEAVHFCFVCCLLFNDFSFTLFPCFSPQGGRSGTKASVMGKEQHRLRWYVQEWHLILHSHQPSTTRPPSTQLPLSVLPDISFRRELSDQRLPAAPWRSQYLTRASWLQHRRHAVA